MIEPPPFEVLLPLGAWAFYVYDCCLLLFDNEAVLHWTGSTWVRQAPTPVVVLRKRLLVLNLLRPNRLCLRTTDPAADLGPPATELVKAVRPLQWGVLLLELLLVAVLPVVSLVLGAGLALLAVFATFYATVIMLLIITARRRAKLGLTRKVYWSIVLDCILCPPFAVNLVRKIALQATTTATP